MEILPSAQPLQPPMYWLPSVRQGAAGLRARVAARVCVCVCVCVCVYVVDTRVHYLRELVRDGHVKLLECAGPQNVADALTKSPPRPTLVKHRQLMWGTRIPFSAFHLSLKTQKAPTASYDIFPRCGCRAASAA